MRPSRDLLERAADKFTIGDGCWEWTASRGPQGYGQIGAGGERGRPLLAHRVLYEALVGPIPNGFELDHLCRNRGCVRPSHLEAVTHAENVRRGIRPLITHCKYGHLLAGENCRLYRRKTGVVHRVCRTCERERSRFERTTTTGLPV